MQTHNGTQLTLILPFCYLSNFVQINQVEVEQGRCSHRWCYDMIFRLQVH